MMKKFVHMSIRKMWRLMTEIFQLLVKKYSQTRDLPSLMHHHQMKSLLFNFILEALAQDHTWRVATLW